MSRVFNDQKFTELFRRRIEVQVCERPSRHVLNMGRIAEDALRELRYAIYANQGKANDAIRLWWKLLPTPKEGFGRLLKGFWVVPSHNMNRGFVEIEGRSTGLLSIQPREVDEDQVESVPVKERFQTLSVELNEWVLKNEIGAKEFTTIVDEIRLWNDWDFDGEIPEHLKEKKAGLKRKK